MINCFISRNSHFPGRFATIAKSDIENKNLKYVFLYDYIGNNCYVINLDKCRNLVEAGNLNYYKGADYIIGKQYGNHFGKNMIVSKAKAEILKSELEAGKTIPY